MKMLWHYAPWARLPEMVESGILRGSNAGAADEKPMLWFSANQQWEPTATKMLTNNAGAIVQMTFKEQAERFGCIRFGISASDPRLLNWKNACAAASMPTGMRQALAREGKKKGGDPSNWYAVASNVPLDELLFQVWMDGWKNATSPQDMAAVWTEHGCLVAWRMHRRPPHFNQ